MAKYKLLPEHEAQFPAWRDKWIANAMSTDAMTDVDRDICREAVNGLYAAAKLPPPKHIVFVPSPFVMTFAGGFAAAIWYKHKGSAATDAATRAATDAATGAATRAATGAATINKWYSYSGDMGFLSQELGLGQFGTECAKNAWRMQQGGNQWSPWDAFLAFFQDVVKLDIDYSSYNHWRALSEHSGPRIMHPDFCIISDRPELLTVDDQNRPHNEVGPFCRWRDGSSLYSWHGARVPARWIESREELDPAEVLREQNVELRAAGAAIVGWPKMLSVLKAKVINDSGSPDIGQLIEVKLPGLPKPGRFLKAHCPRNGTIVEGVPYVSDIDNLPIDTAIAAQAWRIGDPQSEYAHPPART